MVDVWRGSFVVAFSPQMFRRVPRFVRHSAPMNGRMAILVAGVLALGACSEGQSEADEARATDPAAVSTTAAAATTASPTTTPATTVPPTTAAATAPPTTSECTAGRRREVSGGYQYCMHGKWGDVVETTTTIPGRDGSRERPFDLRADAQGGPDILSSDLLETLVAINLRAADWGAIYDANRFNTEPPPGQHYVAVITLATAAGDIEGTLSPYDVMCNLTGDLGRIYEPATLSDTHGGLSLLTDQPDVIAGGSMAGEVYYLVDDADANLQLYCDGTFIIPG